MAKKIILGILVLVLALTLIAGCFSVGILTGQRMQKNRQAEISSKDSTSLEKVEEVMTIIRDTYVEKVSTQKLIAGAIKGMLDALNDPYSRYLDKTHFEMVEEEAAGHYEGVGIMLGMEDHSLTVISAIEETPADRAGVKTGDKITKIDDKPTKDMTINQAVKLIRGPKGTTVLITIERKGEEKPLEFKLQRERIETPNVSSKMVGDNIGYIRLHFFGGDSGKAVKKELDELKSQGAKGIIFDLRNNPGGLLDESVDVASAFIDSGVIVKIKERKGDEEVLEANDGGDSKIPLVVLVNKGSASASEIVAGAVQDRGRGVIVGETTFGKGSVQEIRALPDGSGLLITVAQYLTPKGRSIHKKGVKPDEVVKVDPKAPLSDKDPQLDRAKEILKAIMEGKEWKKAA